MYEKPVVSVIITTRNEEGNIQRCLESIAEQTYAREAIEVIVVDNNSSDRTQEIARHYTSHVYTWGPERSAQRNFGVDKANGDYILYLDADMVLSKDVIKECVDTCENEKFVALYIPERITGRGFWPRVRDFERSFYNATYIDCVRFVRRDTFLQLGGFDESLTGPEDWDFDRRVRQAGRVGIIKAAIYHNEGQFCLARYLRKKGYYAQSFDAYVKKWGAGDPIIKKQLGFKYRLWGVFTEEGKWKRLLRYPVLTAGMYFLRFMVGIRYAFPKEKTPGILLLSPFFSPNIGGVESHLDSLCSILSARKRQVYVVTYQPITVDRRGMWRERRGTVDIRRYPWFGKSLFFRLERHFFLNFFYISSGIFFYAALFLITHRRKVNVIHAHGLNAALVAVILGRMFRKKVVVSTHTIYRLSHNRLLAQFAKSILNRANIILSLSAQGKADLILAGVKPEKIEVYHYWVEEGVFTIKERLTVRDRLGLARDAFIGIFVGRFVEQKGLPIVTRALEKLVQDNFLFLFIGDGPEKSYLDRLLRLNPQAKYLGIKDNAQLADYYNASDVFLWGSLDSSYLGRVCIEALYCGLPIIAPNRCRILGIDYRISEDTLPSSVGFLIPPAVEELSRLLDALSRHPERLRSMRSACREFALEHYGLKNVDTIINSY